MITIETIQNKNAMERKNPVTLKNVCGLVSVIVMILALAFCTPNAGIPDTRKPAKAPAAVETAGETSVSDPMM